ncbi:Chloride channel, voltage gated, partial [Sesbania bispinosa]
MQDYWNDLFKQDWRSRTKIEIYQYVVLKWTLALLIGLFTGLVAFFNTLGVRILLVSSFYSPRISCSSKSIIKLLQCFFGCNMILAIAAAALCAYIAPAAAGSGIPEIFGSIFGVAAGFVVGKEGPMVHTGACVANLLGQGAAGVAGAFRAPVGGVLFALEEAASWWRSALLWRTFFTTAVVAVVLRALIQV